MPPKYTIKYNTLVTHPIWKAVFIILLINTLLALIVTFRHGTLYGSLPPLVLYTSTVILLIAAGFNKHIVVSKGRLEFKRKLYGVTLSENDIKNIKLKVEGKYAQFVYDQPGTQVNTNMVYPKSYAHELMKIINSIY